jgi:flagellar hook-length control protein FliK
MIAQNIITTPPAKAQQAIAQAQQATSDTGFLSLLSTNDSALTDIAQKTSATVSAAAANSNKSSKNDDATATPYIAAPIQAMQNQANKAIGGAANTATNAINAAAKAAGDTATPTDSTAAPGTGNGTGNSTSFGADQLNARVAAGAPIYSSQPTAAMATVPAHLLDTVDPHTPGAPTAGTAAADDKTQKAAGADAADASAATGPTGALTPSATAPIHAARAPSNDPGSNSGNNDDDDAAASNAASGANSTDTASASLMSQPTAPQSAPAQIDAAMHTAAPYVPVGEQVALNIKSAVNDGNNEIRIQLTPESLGTIDVKLTTAHDGRISAVITADRSDTLNMLKQDSGTLQQALQDAGLKADANSLSFNLSGGDAQSFAQNSSQSGGNGGRFYPNTGDSGSDSASAAAPIQRSHAGALNIEV